MDMEENTRRIAEEQRVKTEYAYLFDEVRRTASMEAVHLRGVVRRLEDDLAKARLDLRFKTIELHDLKAEQTRRKTSSGPTAKKRNRVVYWVTAYLNNDTAAAEMGSLLWKERRKQGNGPEPGMKVVTWSAEGNVLKLVIDYTVKGGNPHDIWREDGNGRPGMLNRAAGRLGVKIFEVECDERSREVVEEDDAAA